MRKFIVTLFLLIISYLLQTTYVPHMAVAGITPNIILIVCAYSGYINGRTAGLFTGFVAGLLVDFQFGSVLGLYALIYMSIAYLCGLCHKLYFRDDSTMPLVIIMVSDLLYGLLEYIFNFAFRNKLNFTFYFKRIIMPEIIYTIIISIILYRIILYLYKHQRKAGKQSLFKKLLKKEADNYVG